MFSSNIAWYLFFAGTGSGAAFVVFILDSYLRVFRPWAFQQYRFLIAPGLIAGILLVALGSVFLVFDLGRFDRLVALFLNPSLSILSIGAWALIVFLLVTIAQLFLRLQYAAQVPKLLHILIRWLSAAASVTVMTYTGILLQSLHAIHFWATPLLPALFALSSLSAGAALLLVMAFARQSDGLAVRPFARLSRFHIPILLGEFLILALYLWLMTRHSVTATSAVATLLWGNYALLFWGGVVCCGLLIPFVLEVFSRSRTDWNMLLASSMLLLAGALALRFCILGVGAPPILQLGATLI
jgi:formate-dependent nitrite reductase membrane component NrfD